MHEEQTSPEASDLNIQRQFWNGWIAETLGESGHGSFRRGETVLRLLKSLKLLRPHILEVGCANGWLSIELAQLGQVTGIDLADKPIAAAKSRYPNINFIQGDFVNLDLPAGHFDIVVSVDVIGSVSDQRGFIDKISRVLKHGGYVILICPHKFVWDRTDFIRRSHGEIPLNWLNMKDLKGLLSHRFCLLHSETIIPGGNRGILRLINSRWLNAIVREIVPDSWIVTAKERAGLGKSLVALAQKRMLSDMNA